MAGMFDFLANDPTGTDGYNAMEMRRKIAMQLMGQQKKYPKNIGEGLSAIGDSIGEIGMMRALMRQQGALDASRNRTMATPPPDALPSPTSPRAEAEPTPDVVASARPDDIPAAPTRTAQAEPGVEDGGYNFIDAQAGGHFKPTPGYLQDAIAARETNPDMQAYYGGLSAQEAPKGARDVSPTGAAGPYQFTRGTGAQYGVPGNARFDPGASTDAVRQFTADNAAKFEAANGRPPTFQELAVMHQQGAKGGIDLLAGRAAPAGNLAVNNMAGFSPQAAVAKMNRFYGMPGETAPVGRDAIAATLAGRAPAGAPDAQDARLAEVTGMGRGPTGAFAYAPTASRSGDIVSDAPGITGISPKVGAAAADTLQQQARPPAPEVPQVNPTLPTPLTASTAGSPPEAAGNRPIMTDIKPQPAPAPGAQMAQATMARPQPLTPQPTPPVQAPGIYGRPVAPPPPSPQPRSNAQKFYEERLGREQDPVLQQFYKEKIAPMEAERVRREAITMKGYESDLAAHNASDRAWQDAQRNLPKTQAETVEAQAKALAASEAAKLTERTGLPADVTLGKFDKLKTVAEKDAYSLQQLRLATEAINKGIVSGAGGEFRLNLERAKAYFGNKSAAEIATNSQLYLAAVKSTIGNALQNLQPGDTRVTNSDVLVATGMIGGDLSLQKEAQQKLLGVQMGDVHKRLNEYEDLKDRYLGGLKPEKMFDVKVDPIHPREDVAKAWTDKLLKHQDNYEARAAFDKEFGPGAAELEIGRARRRNRLGQ